VYLKNFEIIPMILSAGVLLLIYPESAFAWFILIRKIGVGVSIKNALYVWVVSNSSRYLPGSIWQYVGRVELGMQAGIPRQKSILAVLYETLLIIIAGLFVSLFTISYWSTVGIKSYMVVLGVLFPLVFLHPTVINKALLLLAKFSKKQQPAVTPLKVNDYVTVLPFFLINFFLNGIALTFLVYSFTGDPDFGKLFLFSGMYALSWLVGYFSIFAPGGIGVTEVALALLLSLYLPLPLASAVAVSYRFLLVIAEIIVFVLTLKLGRSETHFEYDKMKVKNNMAHYKVNPHQTLEWEDSCVETRRDLKSREKRLRMFNIKRTDSVLDLGCGDGLNVALLNKIGIKKVVGVDISKKLLRMAKKKNPNTKFYVGSAETLPFKASSFNIVLIDSVLHHLMDYGKPAREIKRVLKKGGRLCFMEPHKTLLRSLMDMVCILPFSNYFPFIGKRAKAYKQEIELMTHWLATEDEFLDTLKKNGFRKIFLIKDFLSIVAAFRKI